MNLLGVSWSETIEVKYEPSPMLKPAAVLAQKVWGIASSALYHRLRFIRSLKLKKIQTPYRPTFEIYRICNILNLLKNFPASF